MEFKKIKVQILLHCLKVDRMERNTLSEEGDA